MKKISIIVPVYNTEKYLSKCIESLVRQTYRNIEVIIVNDGSTDNSKKIVEKYLNIDNRIKYFKKENGGLSDARNYGVSKATGDYICFVDSDDYIDIRLLEKLSSYYNENYDIIKYKAVNINEDGEEIERVKGPIFNNKNGEEAFELLMAEDVFLEAAWLYLYNLDFYKKNKFKFLENTYHEDFGLIPIVILKAHKVVSTEVYGYYYVQTNNSITRNIDKEKNIKRAYDLFKHYDNMVLALQKGSISEKSKKQIKSYYTNAILLRAKELSNTEQKKYIKEIKKRKLIQNIYITNFRQFIKKNLLKINIKLYLKLK